MSVKDRFLKHYYSHKEELKDDSLLEHNISFMQGMLQTAWVLRIIEEDEWLLLRKELHEIHMMIAYQKAT